MFKAIRKIYWINRIIRNFLKKSSNRHYKYFGLFKKKIRTSGIIQCSFNEYNFKMYNRCDDQLVDHFYYNYKYNEEADLKLFMVLSKFSMTILDIGANTGLYSILSSLSNSESKIYSFEPHPANMERLKYNLSLNEISNVNLNLLALGDFDGSIELSVPSNNAISDVSSTNHNFSSSMYAEINWKKIDVPISTLDTYITNFSKKIDLIKCDVETFEIQVFNGMKKVLANSKPTIIFECFLNEERTEFFNSILSEFNYHLYLILEQGIVYSKEGFVETNLGLNYLITPNQPTRTFINYSDENLPYEVLIRPSRTKKMNS